MPSYGTSFEDLSDEERSTVKKKPRAVHDEIVTDERGKRRFHGAFTGGFSAGYFNTVGSKDGWVPKTFKSSRESRAEKTQYAAEDFMDTEDFGEFGIASKRIRTKADFSSSTALSSERNQLAWERSSFVTTIAESGLNASITTTLADMLKPVSDSIGVRLMKKMGWRAGKGVGPSMTRRELEKQKVIDAKTSGKLIAFDEEAVCEVEVTAPDAEFCPTDAPDFQFTQKDNVHGLGYVPLQETSVLAQNYGSKAAGLKASRSGKAIRGQAFGVGAYEDEDEDIYTTYDLNQYDFEVGASSSTVTSTSRFDCSFVLGTTPAKGSRKFFEAPKPPPGYRPVVKLQPEDITKNLSERVLKAGENLTPFQRAKFLGEQSNSVLELLNDTDRKRLMKARASGDAELREKPYHNNNPKHEEKRENRAEPFEEEPMKNHRFKQFVQYLKRGIEFPQPAMLTRLEWEKELSDFKDALSPELRALLPEVSARQQPLAKVEFSQPIAEQLKSRFQSEVCAEENTSMEKSVKLHTDHDRIQAVRMNMFGEMTRFKYKWYPSKEVCKRFNVPPPYPESSIVGVPELEKRRVKYDEFSVVGKRDVPSTVGAIREHKEREVMPQQNDSNIAIATHITEESLTSKDDNIAPFELLRALFEESSSDESSDSDDEENKDTNQDSSIIDQQLLVLSNTVDKEGEEENLEEISIINEEKPLLVEKVITVFDLVEDDDVYGPKPPPDLDERLNRPVIYDVTDNKDRSYPNDEESVSDSSSLAHQKQKLSEKHKRKKHKKHRKESKRGEKHKKHHKHKSKSKHRSRDSSSSSSSVKVIE